VQRTVTSRRLPADAALAFGLGAAALALYAATLAPTVLPGDGGEFQFVPYLLGVAHPTGYPLYCLLGGAWSRLLPLGDVAYRMNLFSAVCAAAAVALLYPTALELLHRAGPELPRPARRLLAALASATLAATPTLWSQAVMAEVYGLHILILVLLLYLLLAWSHRRGGRKSRLLLLAALCFGLGLAHHSTTVLWLPAAVAFLWLETRSAGAPSPARGTRPILFALSLLAALALPLLLYLYIPLRAPHTPYLHQRLADGQQLVLYENALPNLVDFVTGGPFGGSVDFGVDLGQRLAMAGGFLRDEVGWVGVALAALGLLRLLWDRRWSLLALTGLAYLAVVAFDLVYTIGDIYVLFIPSYLVIVLWISGGVGTLAGLVQRVRSNGFSRFGGRGKATKVAATNQSRSPLRQRAGLWVTLAVVPFFLLPLWSITTYYAAVDRSDDTGAHDGWLTLLSAPIPDDAVLVTNDRNDIMPMWYFQYVESLRPDLLGLFPLITPEYPTLGPVLDLALGTGRPLYLIKEMPGLEVKVAVGEEVRLGGARLWPVAGPAVRGAPGHPLPGRLADALALDGYDLAPGGPVPGGELAVTLYWQPLRGLDREYHSFVHLVGAGGETVAQSDHRPGGVYYPTKLWRPGERLRDEHVLTLPGDLAPGDYRLLAGMYAFAADGGLEPLGEPLSLGELTIGR